MDSAQFYQIRAAVDQHDYVRQALALLTDVIVDSSTPTYDYIPSQLGTLFYNTGRLTNKSIYPRPGPYISHYEKWTDLMFDILGGYVSGVDSPLQLVEYTLRIWAGSLPPTWERDRER